MDSGGQRISPPLVKIGRSQSQNIENDLETPFLTRDDGHFNASWSEADRKKFTSPSTWTGIRGSKRQNSHDDGSDDDDDEEEESLFDEASWYKCNSCLRTRFQRICVGLGLTFGTLLITLLVALVFLNNWPTVKLLELYEGTIVLDVMEGTIQGPAQHFKIYNSNWFTPITVDSFEVSVLYEYGDDFVCLGTTSAQNVTRSIMPRSFVTIYIPVRYSLELLRIRTDIYWDCFNGDSLPLSFVGFMDVKTFRKEAISVQFGPMTVAPRCNLKI